MVHSNAVIKYKALTFPQWFLFRNILKVLQNAAFQVINLFKPLLFHIGSRFLTTNATRTEHGNTFVFVRVEVFFDVIRELAEWFCMWIHSIFERTHFVLVLITGIDEHYVRWLNELIPVFSLHISTHAFVRIYILNTHGHNFFFEFNLGALEWLFFSVRLLSLDWVKTLVFI